MYVNQDIEINVILVTGLNPGVSVPSPGRSRQTNKSLERLLLVTDVSTTWALVIFRIKWRVVVRCLMVFMPLVLVWIGQFCRDVINPTPTLTQHQHQHQHSNVNSTRKHFHSNRPTSSTTHNTMLFCYHSNIDQIWLLCSQLFDAVVVPLLREGKAQGIFYDWKAVHLRQRWPR